MLFAWIKYELELSVEFELKIRVACKVRNISFVKVVYAPLE